MTGIASRLRRGKFPVVDGPDDRDEIRVYYDPDGKMPPAPSVSVIKGLRTDPEKADTLDGWRNRYDGQSSWARPWYKDQKMYKAYRGTLVHYTILSALADEATQAVDDHNPDDDAHLDASGSTYFHEAGEDGYGYEEYSAEYALKRWSKHAPSANTDEIAFEPRQNRYDGEHAWDRAVREMRWAAKTFNEQFIQTGHVTPAHVRAVEEFVCHPEHGYAGQFDLLYDHNGETRLADLKTSSGVRFDHKLQAAAYVGAAEQCLNVDIDGCEIIRLHPDSETVEVSHSDDWDRSIEGLQHEFYGLCDEAHTVAYGTTLDQAAADLSEHAQSSQQELDDAGD